MAFACSRFSLSALARSRRLPLLVTEDIVPQPSIYCGLVSMCVRLFAYFSACVLHCVSAQRVGREHRALVSCHRNQCCCVLCISRLTSSQKNESRHLRFHTKTIIYPLGLFFAVGKCSALNTGRASGVKSLYLVRKLGSFARICPDFEIPTAIPTLD